MKTLKKKWFLFLLTVCLAVVPVVSMADSASAAGDAEAQATEIRPLYSLILSIHGNCYIENGKIQMTGTVSAQGGRTTSAKVVITLQYKEGTSWKNGSSWSETGTNSATVMASATPGNMFYRLKITGTITYNGQSESDTIYTSVVAPWALVSCALGAPPAPPIFHPRSKRGI